RYGITPRRQSQPEYSSRSDLDPLHAEKSGGAGRRRGEGAAGARLADRLPGGISQLVFANQLQCAAAACSNDDVVANLPDTVDLHVTADRRTAVTQRQPERGDLIAGERVRINLYTVNQTGRRLPLRIGEQKKRRPERKT